MIKIILLAINTFDRWGDANAIEDSLITKLAGQSEFDAVLSRLNENRDEKDQLSPEQARGKILIGELSDFMEDWNDSDEEGNYLKSDTHWLTYATIN